MNTTALIIIILVVCCWAAAASTGAAGHRRLPFTIGTDKHASYPEAFTASVKEKVLPFDCEPGRVKYLNNVIG
jgi:hypothetical protein